MKKFCSLFFLFFLMGCRSHYLSIAREPIDQKFFASTFVHSPDPLQKENHEGQRLILQYRLSYDMDPKDYKIQFAVLFKDLSYKKMLYEPKYASGIEIFTVIDEEYKKRKGILGYEALLIDRQGKVVDQRKSSFWIDSLAK